MSYASAVAKRRLIRFPGDPLQVAWLELGVHDDRPFTPDHAAVVVEESPMGGCSLVLCMKNPPNPGDACRVKVGRLNPIRAEVRWVRPLEERIVRIGLQFHE